jgi:hypothetical protein
MWLKAKLQISVLVFVGDGIYPPLDPRRELENDAGP